MKNFKTSNRLQAVPEQFFAKLEQKVKKAASNADRPIINLGQGSPGEPAFDHIKEALKEAADKPINDKYPPFPGFAYAREACAEFYKREYGVEIDPEKEVSLLIGGKAGLVELPQCLLNPGDIALVPDPGYPDYWSGIALAEAEMYMMPLIEENNFLPRYEDIPEDILKRAKIMFVNYPNNPTGAMVDEEFFKETIAFAKAHDICVVHDFAYGAIGFDGKRPVSYLEVEGAKENGIEIYTMSKTFNMAGWRIGFAVGNPSVIAALDLMHDHLHCGLYGGIQEAAAAALLGPQDEVREQERMYERRRNLLINGLNEIGWKVKAPQGSFFSWLKVPEGYTSEEFSDLLLEKAQVLAAPGIGFGEHGEGYVRAGLVASDEKIKEAIERIDALNLFNK
ncbi:pyridoxal phosphate-dependent aminotransferase [Bacillus thermotolerans]|uniref:Glutamine-dependent 2-keto-4-methylthiobutyrate transaminase n=1 Tax=Bacillus thermotolerans TaxID=1221996 RepID=A0A0F5HV71_BACTR|nr:pyridoxal phosphate-dependent aminotransferase [Bacillus thermotolerans]KKB37138.1 Glutamine-dependent 2-keto-4-methylthiobutyrate transaminase [Bacillus thermotolerans]KKB40166.1 Glutamine-dependent 2-keto-4-methylthiobutyrate transaminase [Bacillus thermotolerans]KKB42624.1 Glutamine-dependent 2-keto-4-methylthiobutyrate transaminase [Bacillus thermotolerans]